MIFYVSTNILIILQTVIQFVWYLLTVYQVGILAYRDKLMRRYCAEGHLRGNKDIASMRISHAIHFAVYLSC